MVGLLHVATCPHTSAQWQLGDDLSTGLPWFVSLSSMNEKLSAESVCRAPDFSLEAQLFVSLVTSASSICFHLSIYIILYLYNSLWIFMNLYESLWISMSLYESLWLNMNELCNTIEKALKESKAKVPDFAVQMVATAQTGNGWDCQSVSKHVAVGPVAHHGIIRYRLVSFGTVCSCGFYLGRTFLRGNRLYRSLQVLQMFKMIKTTITLGKNRCL
jgi:hypothetical protein